MTLEEIKIKVRETIEKNREEVFSVAEEIAKNPELGYKEEKTSKYIREEFEKFGLKYEYPLAITGVKGRLQGKKSKANVCLIAEMDGIKCKGNVTSNNEDVSHACGHNTQSVLML